MLREPTRAPRWLSNHSALGSWETVGSREQMFALPLASFLAPWGQFSALTTVWWELGMLGAWSLQISASFTGVFYKSEQKRTQGCGWKAGKTQPCAQGVAGTGQEVGGENPKEGSSKEQAVMALTHSLCVMGWACGGGVGTGVSAVKEFLLFRR